MPYYIVRYNSESEVPSDIQNGTTIGFVSEFAGHVLNDKNLYQKGYDASGKNDEEIFDEHEAEFSDDEKEAEYRRMIKMSKRGNNNESQGTVNQKKNRRNAKSRENTWTSNQTSSQSSRLPASEPNKTHQHVRSPSSCFGQGNQSGTASMDTVFPSGPSAQSLGQRNQSGPYPRSPILSGGPNTLTQLPQPGPIMFNGNWANGMPPQPQNMAISNGFQLNGNWANGIPPPAQNMAMSSGFQLNGMPWVQQKYPQPLQMPTFPWQQQPNISQFPLGIPGSSQQQFDLSQLLAGINGSSTNFNTGVPNGPWSGMLGPNLSGHAPFLGGIPNPNSNVQLPVFSGFMPNGPQPMGLSSNSMSATSFSANEDVSSQNHQGVASGPGRGRGGGRKSFQQRGGRFRGRRGQ